MIIHKIHTVYTVTSDHILDNTITVMVQSSFVKGLLERLYEDPIVLLLLFIRATGLHTEALTPTAMK